MLVETHELNVRYASIQTSVGFTIGYATDEYV